MSVEAIVSMIIVAVMAAAGTIYFREREGRKRAERRIQRLELENEMAKLNKEIDENVKKARTQRERYKKSRDNFYNKYGQYMAPKNGGKSKRKK